MTRTLTNALFASLCLFFEFFFCSSFPSFWNLKRFFLRSSPRCILFRQIEHVIDFTQKQKNYHKHTKKKWRLVKFHTFIEADGIDWRKYDCTRTAFFIFKSKIIQEQINWSQPIFCLRFIKRKCFFFVRCHRR